MNGKDLLQGMNYVDEKYVAEAECGKKAMSVKVSWLRQIALAACVIILVSGVAVNYGMKQYQYNHRLSGEEIAELRQQYPMYGKKFPELAAIVWFSFEDVLKMADTVIYGEVTGDYEVYEGDVAEWYEYPVSVIEDTKGLLSKEEQISINHTALLKEYYGELSEGMKIIVPVIKEKNGTNRYNYNVIGMYYVTEDGYVISAYDEESRADKVYSGMYVERFLKELRELD